MTRYALEFIGLFGGLAVTVLGGWIMSRSNKVAIVSGFIIMVIGMAVLMLAFIATVSDELRGVA